MPLHVRVLDRAGDSIVGAKVSIVSLNPDTVGVDTTRLAVFGITPGSGSVVAFTGALTSTPLRVTVSRAPDSLAVDSVAVDTVPAGDTVSAPLAALLLDLRTTPGTPIGLAYDTVQFAIVLPVFASDSTATAVLGNDSLSAAVVTGTAPLGQAEVVVKRRGPPPQPDSVVVQARAYRANGAEVHGSPLRFVVYFQ